MNRSYTILVVEDEETDFHLLDRALKKNGITNPVQWLRDGLEALEYLSGQGIYADREKYPYPEVVILDLKTPRLSGMELLAWIRDHPEYQVIPTIIMSSSQQESDIERAYRLGANTYFVKPSDFPSLVEMMKSIDDYWLKGVKPRIRRGQ